MKIRAVCPDGASERRCGTRPRDSFPAFVLIKGRVWRIAPPMRAVEGVRGVAR